MIEAGHCVKAELVEQYKEIGLSLILYFDEHIPMPIRPHKFGEYFELLNKYNVQVNVLCASRP